MNATEQHSPKAQELLLSLCESLAIEAPETGLFLELEISGCPLEVEFTPSPQNSSGSLIISAPIGEVDDDGLHALVMRLLQANMSGPETKGSFFCLTEDLEAVLLRRWIPLDGLDLSSLRTQLAEHLSATLAWQKSLPGIATTEHDTEDHTPDTQTLFPGMKA